MEAAPDEEAGLALPEGERILEVTLISAQGLKPPSGQRRRLLQAYAVAWVDDAHRLQTRAGSTLSGTSGLLFRVHESALADDPRAAVTVEIYTAPTGGWHIGGRLLGRLCPISCLETTASCPDQSGPRRCSPSVYAAPPAASKASLMWRPVSSRRRRRLRQQPTLSAPPPPSPLAAFSTALIPAGRVLRVLNRLFPTPPPSPMVLTPKPNKKCADKQDVAVKLNNNGADDWSDEKREESREMGGVVFCGPCILPLPRNTIAKKDPHKPM